VAQALLHVPASQFLDMVSEKQLAHHVKTSPNSSTRDNGGLL
jgi:hypothetical protein